MMDDVDKKALCMTFYFVGEMLKAWKNYTHIGMYEFILFKIIVLAHAAYVEIVFVVECGTRVPLFTVKLEENATYCNSWSPGV